MAHLAIALAVLALIMGLAKITLAGKAQSTGIEKVSRAITRMDEVTRQNAALVEQADALRSWQASAGYPHARSKAIRPDMDASPRKPFPHRGRKSD